MTCPVWRQAAGVSAHRVGRAGQLDIGTVSANALLSEEANAECHTFLGSISSVVNAQKEILIGGRDQLINYSLRSLSLD
jgi:hypothetical protein